MSTAWNTVSDRGSAAWELVFGYHDEEAYASAVEGLVQDRVASGIAGRNPTLWGSDAEAEAGKRLAWVGLSEESRSLVPQIAELKQQLNDAGLDHVVLCGMGGSSLAPEVICRTHGVELTVVDSSDPDYVRAAIEDRLTRSIVVVSSKSGSTVETDSQRRAYEKALRDAGRDPREHLVVVTDAGSPLDESARRDGYHVFNADAGVGGRYSALTAFGLVPSGLAGADIGTLLDEAEAIRPDLESDDVDNPALRLGALLGTAYADDEHPCDKVVLADHHSGLVGFADWAEQLIAESTGKRGKGFLPVVVPGVDAPNFSPSTADEILVVLGEPTGTTPASGWGAAVKAPLGAAMLLWEYAVPVAGRLVGINPFDQPDVESAKQAARDMLEGQGRTPEPAFTDGPVTVYATDGLLDGETTVAAAVDRLLARLGDRGYLAVMAYLDRHADAGLAGVRESLAGRTGRPTTFGWGPRFLHSTGQYHKGGAPTGVFLQLTGTPTEDLAIPDRPFSFGGFIAAQAIGDAAVLAQHGRPVLRLHLDDHDAGLAAVREVLGGS